MREMRAVVVITMLGAAGCGVEVPERPDVVATSLDEASEGLSPTTPLWVEVSSAIDASSADDTTVLVVRGAADQRFVDDAEKPPLGMEQVTRLVAGRVRAEGRVVRFVPSQPLGEESLHTLVVTKRLRASGRPLARTRLWPFTTGAASSGAPVARLVDPADGAIDIVRNLRAVAVRFSRPVTGVDAASLQLVGEEGPVSAMVAATVAPGDCPTCWTILPDAPLLAQQRYRVIAGGGIVDETGAAPFQWEYPPAFTTGDRLQTEAPRVEHLAASPSSGCVVVRFATDIAAAATLRVGPAEVTHAERTTIHELALPLAPGRSATFAVSARDDSTAPAATAGPLPVPASSLRRLVITEVLAAPLGPWPAQQFVEVANHGATPERLGGLVLHDEGGSDPLPDIEVPPGGRALIVPSTYVPGEGDPTPAPGTVIARTAKPRLGLNGLRQSGEAIALLEADGRAVSRFSTYGLQLARGQSAHRISACDVTGAFAGTPGGISTPGSD